MAASKRKENESFSKYRARLSTEQKAINRAAKGRLLFLSVEDMPYMPWPRKRIAHAVRDGKLSHKSGRRLATAYR